MTSHTFAKAPKARRLLSFKPFHKVRVSQDPFASTPMSRFSKAIVFGQRVKFWNQIEQAFPVPLCDTHYLSCHSASHKSVKILLK